MIRNNSNNFSLDGGTFTPKKWTVHRIMRVEHYVKCAVHFFPGYTSIHRKIITFITSMKDMLKYIVPQVQITGKFLNGYPMFSVKHIAQNVKQIQLRGKNLIPLIKVVSTVSIHIPRNSENENDRLIESKNRSTEGCSKLKSPETRQVQEILVSTLEHLQAPKWDRTRCPEE